MFSIIIQFFNGRSKGVNLGLSYVLFAAISIADYLTGYLVSFSLFYLVPVIMIAWHATIRHSILFCLLVAFIWGLVELKFTNSELLPLIIFWNTLMRLGIFLLVTKLIILLKHNLDMQQHLANRDSLTNLYNRRFFQEQTTQLINLAQRYQHQSVFAFIDIDHFKRLNDTLGHEVGDTALKLVADTLIANSRSTDIVGRLGGDEFVMYLPITNEQEAQVVIARIHQSLTRQVTIKEWPISFSIGVVVFTNPPVSFEVSLKFADETMYKAKKQGKNQIVYS